MLVARGLPETVGEGVVREVVSRWAGKVRPVFEGVEVAEGVLVLRMGSIGTALKARDTVVNVWGARTEWGVDECEGSLEGLGEVWEEIRKENGAKEKGRGKVVMRGWVGSFGR